jgi:hypothetical protein
LAAPAAPLEVPPPAPPPAVPEAPPAPPPAALPEAAPLVWPPAPPPGPALEALTPARFDAVADSALDPRVLVAQPDTAAVAAMMRMAIPS